MSKIRMVITKTGMFIGEVDEAAGWCTITKPMQINYQQMQDGSLKVGISPYPPGVKDLVDDLENHSIVFHVRDVLCSTRPADKLREEYIKGSNAFRNIAVPTTGQIIDVGASK